MPRFPQYRVITDEEARYHGFATVMDWFFAFGAGKRGHVASQREITSWTNDYEALMAEKREGDYMADAEDDVALKKSQPDVCVLQDPLIFAEGSNIHK